MKIKKIFLYIILLFLIAVSVYSQGTWNVVQSPSNEFLRRCFFVDSLYGWVAGDSGIIIKTSDGGQNWVVQNRNRDVYFQDLYFVNRNVGYGIAWHHNFSSYGTIIYKTTNGGLNWTYNLFPDTTVFILSLCFIDENKGFLGTSIAPNKSIIYTSNGGQNWDFCVIDSSMFGSFPVRNIRFLNQNTGFGVGGFMDIAGVIWRTTNGGSNWTSNPAGSEPLFSITFKNNMEVFCSGGDFEYGVSICNSTDAGSSWTYRFSETFGIGASIAFRTSNEFWVSTGFSQKFLFSTNSGNSYSSIDTPDSTIVNWLTFPNKNTGWAVGDKGKILKFTPSGTGINGKEFVYLKDFDLYQNYPNPFNPQTNISFYLKKEGRISLIIYDILGREMLKLINNEFYKQGFHNIMFNTENLPSGIYIYSLNSVLYKQSKRMTLIK